MSDKKVSKEKSKEQDNEFFVYAEIVFLTQDSEDTILHEFYVIVEKEKLLFGGAMTIYGNTMVLSGGMESISEEQLTIHSLIKRFIGLFSDQKKYRVIKLNCREFTKEEKQTNGVFKKM